MSARWTARMWARRMEAQAGRTDWERRLRDTEYLAHVLKEIQWEVCVALPSVCHHAFAPYGQYGKCNTKL